MATVAVSTFVAGGECDFDLFQANFELVPIHLRHGLHLNCVDSCQATDGQIQIDRFGVRSGLVEQRHHGRFGVEQALPEVLQLLVVEV